MCVCCTYIYITLIHICVHWEWVREEKRYCSDRVNMYIYININIYCLKIHARFQPMQTYYFLREFRDADFYIYIYPFSFFISFFFLYPHSLSFFFYRPLLPAMFSCSRNSLSSFYFIFIIYLCYSFTSTFTPFPFTHRYIYLLHVYIYIYMYCLVVLEYIKETKEKEKWGEKMKINDKNSLTGIIFSLALLFFYFLL